MILTERNLEDDVADLAEMMKSDMEDTLKIQRSPWLDWDVLEFEDIYLPVGLNKENRNQNVELIREYKDLFSEGADPSVSGTKRMKRHRHKILIKGAPGIGKTTLVTKMAYDWAVSALKVFSLVFLVSLKCVRPDDPINSFIIDENLVPSIYEREYDLQSIEGIIKKLGTKCLLILEGFDEGYVNEDIMRIIRNLKYASCHIIVTTRPHVAGDIQRHFTTVVNVTGFTKDDAKKYVQILLSEKGKVESVMKFTEENQSIGIHEMWRYPILLLFICILVNDDGGYLDLNDRNITLSDVYTKLHECLYKRYTIRRQLNFSVAKMKHTLVQLGKLALKGIGKGRLLYQKCELEGEVGKDAFHFGIIIGYQDRRVIHDLSADCTVCFLHQSIQEYLAALYMVDELEWSDRQVGDMWPRKWDYYTASKLPLLLIFAIDLSKDKINARKKLITSMASALNRGEIIIQGYGIGATTLAFLAEVTRLCWRSNALTFVNSGFDDDALTWINFLSKMSKAIEKVTFTRCIFRKGPDVMSEQMEKACKIFDRQFEIVFNQVDIPVKTLQILIARCQCIHALDIAYDFLPLEEKQFYKSLLNLLSVPLPSLRRLEINTRRENHYSSFADEQSNYLDLLSTDISSFRCNLPHATVVKLGWKTLYGRLFCNAILTACLDNKCLEIFVVGNEDGETGSTREMMSGIMSLQCTDMTSLMIGDCDPLCDRDRVSHLRQRMLSDSAESNEEINSNFELPQIEWLAMFNLVLFTASEMQALTSALHGGTLKNLKINNFQLPFLLGVLQSEGLLELEELEFHYMGTTVCEPWANCLFTVDANAVCTLPKLHTLEFKRLHGLIRIHQNLLKQFSLAVRGSHCLTVLDISGQNAAACLKTLVFPEGLPTLTEFRAEDCGLLPVDIYRLGKAAQKNRLPSLKFLLLSRNRCISNFLCYLFLGTWPCLETLGLVKIELSSWDIACLGCAATKSDKQHGIMPRLGALLCDASLIPKLTSLMHFGVSICTSHKSQVIIRVYDEIANDRLIQSMFSTSLENIREEILHRLGALQDRDEKFHCYGVVRQWIIDFLREKMIELETQPQI